MTAGSGVQHSEMFPLLSQEEENPLDLYQIWLNLPQQSKMVPPEFKMLWAESIPHVELEDDQGRKVALDLRAGQFGDAIAPAPPSNSWAADPANEVAIWTIKMESGAKVTLPAASPGITRSLFVVTSGDVLVQGETVKGRTRADLRSDVESELEAGSESVELQGLV